MNLFKLKSKRAAAFSVITVSAIVLLLILNFLLTLFGGSNNGYVDLTPEGLYTVSDAMLSEISFVDEIGKTDGEKTVKVTFCTDPDYLAGSLTTRPTYFMATSLANTFDNFEVETVNITNNPTALSQYRPTSLAEIKPTDIVVSYGDRYRIVGAANFWTTDTENDQTTNYFAYNGEYRLATLIKSVTSIEQPKAYFITDHGETYYDANNPNSESSKKAAYLHDLLLDRGLTTDTLKLGEVDEIPEDCALLIINNPREDFDTDKDKFGSFYYVSDTEKIDKYLTRNQGAVMVAKDYAIDLPILEDFLHEWGFDFSTSQVRDSEYSIADENNTNSSIIAVYETEENSYANAIYGDFASISSSPSTVFSNTGYITNSFGFDDYKNEPGSPDTVKRYASFLKSSESAMAYMKGEDGSYLGSSIIENDEGSFDLASVTVREAFDSVKNEYSHSYLFCSASSDFFSNALLGNSSYANFDIVSALVNNITRTDVYASIELGGTSLTSSSYGGKQLVETELFEEDTTVYSSDATSIVRVNKGLTNGMRITYSILVGVLPVSILVLGVIVCIRRRFL